MDRTKASSVAGMFYPISWDELQQVLNTFQEKNKKDYNVTTRAIIAPHAGYAYSGQLASEAFQYLDRDVKNIFIISPSHHVAAPTPLLSDYEHWETPLGTISINQEINRYLIDKFECVYNNEAFVKEHAVEVQVPFIQNLYPKDVKIIPILVNYQNGNRVAEILAHFYTDKSNAFVISSDLSHFHTDEEAKKIDNVTANMIEMIGVSNMNPHQACGSAGICALSEFADKNNYSLIRIGMLNSSATTGDTSRVVGYGAWLLYEEERSAFIKKYFSDFVLDLCTQSIKTGLEKQAFQIKVKIPEVFKSLGAAFVTLQKHGRLRGCIGSIVAHRPLITDLAQHAYDAAFNDHRFEPLKEEEFSEVSISVSLLSAPVPVQFTDEQDLLDKIVPFEDGTIIKDGRYQAVYLPSVWEQIPDKGMFLKSLKVKAGLSPDYFSENFEAFKFSTVYITR